MELVEFYVRMKDEKLLLTGAPEFKIFNFIVPGELKGSC